MTKMQFLNSKKIKEIRSILEKQWGFTENLDYYFLSDGENINIVNKDIAELDLEKIRVNSMGMYLGVHKYGEIRLSLEGSGIIGLQASKNILELSDDDSKKWLKGEDLDIETDLTGFVIVRSGSDFLGTGKVKDGRVLNYVPKSRRLNATH